MKLVLILVMAFSWGSVSLAQGTNASFTNSSDDPNLRRAFSRTGTEGQATDYGFDCPECRAKLAKRAKGRSSLLDNTNPGLGVGASGALKELDKATGRQ